MQHKLRTVAMAVARQEAVITRSCPLPVSPLRPRPSTHSLSPSHAFLFVRAALPMPHLKSQNRAKGSGIDTLKSR